MDHLFFDCCSYQSGIAIGSILGPLNVISGQLFLLFSSCWGRCRLSCVCDVFCDLMRDVSRFINVIMLVLFCVRMACACVVCPAFNFKIVGKALSKL